MLETNISVTKIELDTFKEACEKISGIGFISHDGDMTATIAYKWDFNLFYLGKMHKMLDRLAELNQV